MEPAMWSPTLSILCIPITYWFWLKITFIYIYSCSYSLYLFLFILFADLYSSRSWHVVTLESVYSSPGSWWLYSWRLVFQGLLSFLGSLTLQSYLSFFPPFRIKKSAFLKNISIFFSSWRTKQVCFFFISHKDISKIGNILSHTQVLVGFWHMSLWLTSSLGPYFSVVTVLSHYPYLTWSYKL